MASLVHKTSNLDHDKRSGLICSLVSDKSLRLICPAYSPVYSQVYMRARLQPGLTEKIKPRLLSEMLHTHQDKVRAYSPADAQF